MNLSNCIKIGQHAGIDKYICDHAQKQFNDRWSKEDFDLLQRVYNDTIDLVIAEYGLKGSQVYVAHSESTDMGLVIRIERKKSKICTVLPPKKVHYASEEGDISVLVEMDAREKSGLQKMQEASCEGGVHIVHLYENEVTVTFWEGKLYDIDCEFIQVD